MRNFFPALLSGCGYTINTYNSSATIVTVLHVPHELEDSVVRYVLGRYGKVICGRYLTFKKYPTVYNGIRQYQMDLKRDIPSSLRLGERSCWVRFEEQPRTCLRCGDESHEVRDCKNIKCLKCHTLGHVAKDCTSEVVCNICEGSGHTYRDCPVSFAHKIQPIPRKWQQTSVGESDIVSTSNATKSSENSQITLKPVEGEVRKGYWKYNVSLNNDEDFCNDLRFHYQLWKTLKPGFPSLSEWWEEVKNRVKKLAIKHSKRRANEKKEWLKHLQTRCRASQLEDVYSVISAEAEGAFIRSRANYLDLGERPSSFFFRLESRRGNKKVIRSIRGPNGDIYDRKDDICKVFHEYYSSLFSKDKNTDSIAQNDFIKNLNVSIHTHHKEELDLPFSIDEVFSALKTTSKNKAPGIDGLPYEFFHNFFDLIGTDLLEVYNDVFERGCLTSSQQVAVISLIAKKGDILSTKNWRPISLLNADYKILSKVLQTRLAKVMPGIVNVFQTCAVPGRTIHNNLILIRDIIDYTQLKNTGCCLLSVDQEKAFDKVDWSFLFKVLCKLGFGGNFVKWISILYTDIKSRLLINGELSDPICISRGVRQGCPLSPLLYVLFIEPVARYIDNCNDIEGFHLPSGTARKVKFIQYADDATCITSNATGASVNFDKTQGLKLGRLASEPIPLDIAWSTTRIKVTGIMFGSKDAILENWSEKVKKATRRANFWKSGNLSLFGKTVVVNSLLYPLFYFIAPVFPIPESVIKEVNKIVFAFIWGEKNGEKKPDLVNRKVMVLPKDEGGMGLDSLKDKMDVLLAKPLFTMLDSSDVTPTHLMFARYFTAKVLRVHYSQLWSNSMPNADVCTDHLVYVCQVIKRLCTLDRTFTSRNRTKQLVKLLRDSDVKIACVDQNPSYPWSKI
ncbi:hypothetical protein HOLleu_43920 [Holothuria leucospilota]|uniref:Reverse transcriptase domain-containing protein n=1 Tax=Holothuria leucospilota TaxID=206669 RepID=A0A9Q1BAS3_HOLLE|nr:hypothetical protein HOLleu_43920 [Holothuria leucospilota]